MIMQSTPVLFVDDLAPSRSFFEKLGFEVTVSVPEGEGTDFVIMTQGGRVENGVGVMLQTRRSASVDMPDVDDSVFEKSLGFLFMSVADVSAAERALAGYQQVMPRRQTFYGALEVCFREPGGHYVVVAEFATASDEAG